jgi:NodT family efflux transporter outer membrane factor (OMF) lipoprotein
MMRRPGFLAALALLAACTAGPDYVRPPAPVPVAFKEAEGWKVAQPSDLASRGAWWSVYSDPLLDGLIAQVDVSNQNLRAAEAAFRQARAAVRAGRSEFLPTASFNAAATRAGRGGGSTGATGLSRSRTETDYDFSVAADWELDVWGRIRRSVEGSTAGARASAADLGAARLSAQSDLATAYFQLRAADQQRRLLDAATVAYAESLRIATNQYNAGVAPRSDMLQAETQLETTRAQAVAVGVQRAQLEHAIALLIGKPPAELTIAPTPMPTMLPDIPLELPSVLLERRPDIAAAERRMAQANAQIGVAEAAFFPTLSLGAAGGFTSTALDTLFTASTAFWSFGPALAQSLFDGGLRSANVEQARAAYDQTVANYRQTVLTAFGQIEDQLAALRILASQAAVQQDAVRAAREAERLTTNQYRAGTIAYTAVITAQTAALNNELSALNTLLNRLTAGVALVRALGGGWDASTLPAPDKLYDYTPPGSTEPPAPAPGMWSGFGDAIKNLFK